MAFNILVVDDSVIVQDVIAKTLDMAEVPVGNLYKANNGKEALEILEKEWVDLVFSDINMPVMDGVALIEEMFKHDLLKTIPVVIVSTEGSVQRIEELKEKGIVAYIRKPFTPEQIRNVIVDILGEIKEDGNSEG